MDTYFDTTSRVAMSRAGDLCIVAGEEHIAALQASPALGNLGTASLIALRLADPLPVEALSKKRVLVIEVDPNNPESLRRVRSIRESHRDLKIIAAMAQTSVALTKTLVRQGICDVAELPFNPDELAAQVLDALSLDLAAYDEVALAPLYLVVRSVGGSGSTSVLTHLAAALAEVATDGKGVCLADLDLQGGEVAAYSGVQAPVTIGALIEAGERFDDELVSSAILETRHGFSVVAAPEAIMPLDSVSDDQIEAIVTSLRRRFGIVLIDLPANWSNWSLSLSASAERILVVADSSIASLKQARRRIDLLESIGVNRDSIGVIANRVERRLFRAVGTDDIAQALRAKVIATLGDEGAELRAAQDQGALLSETAGRNAYVKSIAGLAAHLTSGDI
jgi:pilus assembly protein CpaE